MRHATLHLLQISYEHAHIPFLLIVPEPLSKYPPGPLMAWCGGAYPQHQGVGLETVEHIDDVDEKSM